MKNYKLSSILIVLLLNILINKTIIAQTANLGNNIVSSSNTTLVIPLNLINFNNVGSMDIRILYDNSKLSFISIENLSSDATGTLANAVVLNGTSSRVNISWLAQGSNGVNFQNGKFLDIKFNYIGGNANLSFDQLECEVADWNGYLINVNYSNVNITENISLQSFNVYGGGSYCQSGNGVSVNLSGSQSGVNYQIKKNGVSFGNIVAGNGNTITWNNLLSGNYTVIAYNSTDSLLMSGNAIVNEMSNLPVSVSVSASQNPVISGTNVTFTASPTNGGTNPIYHWYLNNQIIGTNINNYSFIPSNNDVIKCVLTSSELCATNNPATSNLITMVVNQPLITSVNLGDTVLLSEKNSIISIPLNFTNMVNIGSIDLKIDFDSTVVRFIDLDSVSTEAAGVLYNVINKTGTIKTLNISWLAMGTTGVNMNNLRFFLMKFLYKEGETNLTFNTNLCEISNWDGDILQVFYKNKSIKGNYKTINLTFFLEGLFNGINMNAVQDEMGNKYGENIADLITIELYNGNNPVILEGTFTNQILSINGNCQITIPSTYNASYYIVIKHRNSVTTWSAYPVSLNSTVTIYNFSNNANKAYGDNQNLVGTGIYAIYVGDVNQDGLVDGSDMSETETENNNFSTGYLVTDVNGDGLVDGSDMSIVETANNNFVSEYSPLN